MSNCLKSKLSKSIELFEVITIARILEKFVFVEIIQKFRKWVPNISFMIILMSGGTSLYILSNCSSIHFLQYSSIQSLLFIHSILIAEIYHQMLVKLKIWDPKYVNFLLFRGVGPPFWSGSPSFRNFWIRHWNVYRSDFIGYVKFEQFHFLSVVCLKT